MNRSRKNFIFLILFLLVIYYDSNSSSINPFTSSSSLRHNPSSSSLSSSSSSDQGPPLVPVLLQPYTPVYQRDHLLSQGNIHLGRPYGKIYQRYDTTVDRTTNNNHGTWIVTNARINMQEPQSITILGGDIQDSTSRKEYHLPVRGNHPVTIVRDPEPMECTHTVPLGIYHSPDNDEFWDNYWHWNWDTFVLLYHTISDEIERFVSSPDSGSNGQTNINRMVLFSGILPNNRLRRNGKEPPNTHPSLLYDELAVWIQDSLEMLFNGKIGTIFLKRKDLDETSYTDKRVICVDRLYIGADRQCAHQGDRDERSTDKTECQSIYKLWRSSVWLKHNVISYGKQLGINVAEPITSQQRPVIFTLVTRAVGDQVSGKRMLNEEEVIDRTKTILQTRYGTNGWQLRTHTCDSIADTARWWSTSSVVALGRGACQANIPLTRTNAAVIYISLCAGGAPQLTPQPDYFTIVIHQQENPPPDNANGCNYQDYTVNVENWGKSVEIALQAVHPV